MTAFVEPHSPAQPDEFRALDIGPLRIWPPVVLAPMAGITNAPFRQLCRRFGAGLYVSEMVTARLLVQRDAYTLGLARFAADESPRSIQLYGIDPYHLGEAAKMLVAEGRVNHIDLNFGCPVRKITRKGGGAAIPLKPQLLRSLVGATVRNAGNVPVTIKMRIGIDERHPTYLTAGRIAADEGCAAVALHARTAADLYHPEVRWETIAELKSALPGIPVLGNGNIWEAGDALEMMRQTGCDGVVVGRGCLGKPWLFRELAEMFNGRSPAPPPSLLTIADTMRRHAKLLAEWLPEHQAVRSFRKHCSWYLQGFQTVAELRSALMRAATFADVNRLLNGVVVDEDFPRAALRMARGKVTRRQKVSLPDGYLQQLTDDTPPDAAAEARSSGG